MCASPDARASAICHAYMCTVAVLCTAVSLEDCARERARERQRERERKTRESERKTFFGNNNQYTEANLEVCARESARKSETQRGFDFPGLRNNAPRQVSVIM